MTSMRDLLNLFKPPEVDEAGAGPSRIIQHIHDGRVFIMLSAMRGNLKHAENLQRTKRLRQMLTRLPVSFIETQGEYSEIGQDRPSQELSFFVMPKRGSAAVTAGPFRQFGVELMKIFEQDSILYGDGRLASLIFADGVVFDLGNTLTFRSDVIKDLGGFSRLKRRDFSFTDEKTAAKPIVAADGEPVRVTKGTRYGAGAMQNDPEQKAVADKAA